MRHLKDRITPSILISSLALFVALGGASYAALGKNSVGSKQLKKNAVVTKKIKKNAVTTAKIASGAITTAKIKNNAVNGDKVLESSLGQVPSAASASNATSATNAEHAANLDGYQRLSAKRLTPSFSDPTYAAAMAGATKVPLYDFGQAKVYAKCFKTGTSLYGSMYVETTANGTTFDSPYDNLYGYPYLNVGTPEIDREILVTSVGMDSVSYSTGNDPTVILTPDGKSYQITNALYVKQGSPPSGDGPYGSGDACIFLGEGGQS